MGLFMPPMIYSILFFLVLVLAIYWTLVSLVAIYLTLKEDPAMKVWMASAMILTAITLWWCFYIISYFHETGSL